MFKMQPDVLIEYEKKIIKDLLLFPFQISSILRDVKCTINTE